MRMDLGFDFCKVSSLLINCCLLPDEYTGRKGRLCPSSIESFNFASVCKHKYWPDHCKFSRLTNVKDRLLRSTDFVASVFVQDLLFQIRPNFAKRCRNTRIWLLLERMVSSVVSEAEPYGFIIGRMHGNACVDGA